MALTAGAVITEPWWAVLIVSTAGGTLGMLPGYAVARWATPPKWRQFIETDPKLERYRRWARSHMFLLQVLLTSTPTPHLVSSGLAGITRYSVLLFLLAQAIGQGTHNSMLVAGGVFLKRYRWFIGLEAFAHRPIAWIVLIAVTALLFFAGRLWRGRGHD